MEDNPYGMARLLALSSQVVRGTVGLSAIVPAWQRLGHEVIAVPTVILSNHPAPGRKIAGTRIAAADLDAIIAALDANDWLTGIHGVLTGYLPSADAVVAAARAVSLIRSRSPEAIVLCDPILGDDPKGLYIEAAAAEAIRDTLLPLADLATPNRFELAYLSARPVQNRTDAARALECLACGGGVATSIPGTHPGYLDNVLSIGLNLAITAVGLRSGAPHGTGDLMAALLLSALVQGKGPIQALRWATAAVDSVLEASGSLDRLSIEAMPVHTAPWPCETWGG